MRDSSAARFHACEWLLAQLPNCVIQPEGLDTPPLLELRQAEILHSGDLLFCSRKNAL